MTGEEPVGVDHRAKPADVADGRLEPKPWTLLPPAITPIGATDVAVGIAGQLRGRGRASFRSAITTMLGADGAATYTSFRRALAACLLELDRLSADRTTVLVPAFCSPDFAKVIEGVDLRIERIDVDPETLGLDVAAVREHVDDDALALLAVNPLGYTSRMDAIAESCERHGVALVEALGYALTSAYGGKPLGTFGDCAVLNFQQGKPIPVGGGMVVSQSTDLDLSDAGRPAVGPNVAAVAGYAACSRPRTYFLYSAVADRLDRYGLVDDRITTHPGSKLAVEFERPFATMSNFQGAVGNRVLERLDDHRRHRASTARYYAEELEECPGLSVLGPVDGLTDHQYVRFPVLASSSDRRDDLLSALRGVGVQATMLYDWPPVDERRHPGAARLQNRILTLPTHPYVDERSRELVVETIRDVVTGW